MVRQSWLLASLMALGACSGEPSGGQTERLQVQLQELNQQLRQYRSEVQRSNEKIVAMLQAHGLQSDNPAATSPGRAADAHAGHGTVASHQPSSGVKAGDVGAALHRSHATMDQQMMSVPITGDADRDFLAMMIPHHQGAIDMARIIIESGKRPEVRKFAEDIIAHQQAEIDLMKRWMQVPPQ